MSRYFNSTPYELTAGDSWPAYVVVVGSESTGRAADLSDYPSLIATAVIREKGEATSLAATAMSVNKPAGTLTLSAWPSAVRAADVDRLELQIVVDYFGDATYSSGYPTKGTGTQVKTLNRLLQYKVNELFGAPA